MWNLDALAKISAVVGTVAGLMMLRLAYLAYGLQKKQQDKRQRQTVRQA
jgi:hypothetical protein